MGGLLRFTAWFVLLASVLVLVVLPLLLSPMLASTVRDMGLRSQTLNVSVALFDPSLLLARSRRVTVVAGGVDASPARIGHLELSLGDVSYFDRSFGTVTGELRDVTVTLGSDILGASFVKVDGPAEAASLTARLTADQTEALIRAAAGRSGVTVDSVRIAESGVLVGIRGQQGEARISVRGGALLLEPQSGGVVLLVQSEPSDPWTLRESWISDRGLNIAGTVDMRRLVREL